jgi:hypothetical protein
VPINPSNFSALQTDPGQVQLSWQTVRGASYYVLLGSGLPDGALKVSGATTFTVIAFMATAVPSGRQQWAVASDYEPGAISTAPEFFPRIVLDVTSPVTLRR